MLRAKNNAIIMVKKKIIKKNLTTNFFFLVDICSTTSAIRYEIKFKQITGKGCQWSVQLLHKNQCLSYNFHMASLQC